MKMKNIKGMVLTEALVAVATLATATIILGSMITSGIDSTKTSRDYLLAQNLLTEGLEVVKNIRDSNRLIRPDKPDCWLYAKPASLSIASPDVNCAHGSVGTAKNYLILNEANRWKLVDSGVEGLNLQNNQESNEKYHLKKYDSDDPSKFYRSIVFLEITVSSATFEVKVQWEDGAKVRTVNDSFILSNYLQ